MPNLTGKVVLVTGANRGQGRDIAKHLASLGAKVALGARDIEKVKALSLEIGEDKCLPLQLDVTKEEDWISAVNSIISTYKKVDVLVNNAGVFMKKPILDTTVEDFQELINVNQLGVFRGIKAVAPFMQKQQNGSIINNVSISSFAPINQSAAYAATKAAVSNLSKSAAIELGRKGIRVNVVHPGVIETDMVSNNTLNLDRDAIPLGRMGKANDIANVIAFLASDQSAYCNGTEIVVDGGLTLGTDI
ncbi:3-oxoacyl-[acyl-carrier-protein] reductase [Sporosarcina newyorkensis 2681]|uniref:3-oxoacyl-[acyl-carrier-protein] reductase n=1 Tax=Sporosarcina newyorkensis 2681 TaxID=1027292 RepID=F9DVR5_9BACL|nr:MULTISPECIES: SDR family NAD(P)-dependent oxidoreductase [Sporosarcina]EGQ22389.1 3-oxoacyl-[acyl-carrier-protein] reductase [Sporosarcina newyorkensis 2681]MBY0222458.1 SDR family oxidoreductase [Sporosarcina aquimarina]